MIGVVKKRDTKSANLNTFKPMTAAEEAKAEAQLAAQFHDKMMAEIKAERRKVAILGSASSSFKLAPFDDKSWEIWNLAWRVNDSPRNDLLFEIHHRGQWKWNQGGTEEVLKLYTDFLTTTKIPVYLIKEQPDIPAGIRYPLAEVAELMGGRKYFASSIGFMLGLLALQIKNGRKVDEVGLWGIDLLCEDEFAEQRPNAEFLLGMLHAMGVKLIIPSQSALLKCNHTYGEEDGPTKGGISAQWLARRKDEYVKARENHLEACHTYSGAHQAADLFATDPEKAPANEKDGLLRIGLTPEQRAAIAERGKIFAQKREHYNSAIHRADGSLEILNYLGSMAAHYERGGVLPD